jgi:hypothetical protein
MTIGLELAGLLMLSLAIWVLWPGSVRYEASRLQRLRQMLEADPPVAPARRRCVEVSRKRRVH